MWATIVTLTRLEVTYGGEKDEWEMVGHKARVWLASQNLLGRSLEEWMEDAKAVLLAA